MGERTRKLRIAALEAEKSARQPTFLATMSHDLRTPLNAMLGFNELMRGAVFGPLGHLRCEGYAEDIARSGQHLLSMINDILDLAEDRGRRARRRSGAGSRQRHPV